MKREVKVLTFKEKVEAFLTHLEIARLNESSLCEEFVTVAVNDFCSRVARSIRACLKGKPRDEKTVRCKMKIKAPEEEVWRVSSILFWVVEQVECRLFNANSLFGISRNEIATHFQDNCDKSGVYSFWWRVMFRNIKEPCEYPTIESTLEEIHWQEVDYKRRLAAAGQSDAAEKPAPRRLKPIRV